MTPRAIYGLTFLGALLVGCSEAGSATAEPAALPPTVLPPAALLPKALPAIATSSPPVVARARLEVSRAVTYDPAWFPIPYPNGDPAPDRGVCTDVVIRSLRAVGIDLQQRIHEDILRRPAAYPTVTRADPNIDHRRAGPMLTYLRAHATALPHTFEPEGWKPGDVVVWAFHACPACRAEHVGIVSDRRGPRDLPLVIHNLGPTPSEDDRLDAWTVLGHFRLTPPAPRPRA